ncbi:MAG: M48 family metalloprotease [Saprospiraceae bacterium]
MKSLIYLTSFLFILISNQASAQYASDYKPLKCEGVIPDEFSTKSSIKYQFDIARLESGKMKKEEYEKKLYVVASNFEIDKMIKSGLVLFNDPVSNYLNEVCNKLLESDPSFNKAVRVYTLRSTAVNAFATDRGSIFVTLGLLARLENEAQLAFVLSHEMTHVKEGHVLKLFEESSRIDKNADEKKVVDESVFDKNLIKKNQYSQELETEADSDGLRRFLKTDYSTDGLPEMMDVLKYGYLPFKNEVFDTNYFNKVHYSFPYGYWLTEMNALSEDPETETEYNTHPHTEIRKAELQKVIEEKGKKGGASYLVSEEKFRDIRERAKNEIPLLHLQYHELPEAIYTSYLLEKEKGSLHAKKCLARALYLRAKLMNEDAGIEIYPMDEIEGEIQQVYALLASMDNKETTTLAMDYLWNLHNDFVSDPEILEMTEDLFEEIFNAGIEEEDLLSKAIHRDSTKEDWEDVYWKNALVQEMQDEKFLEALKKGEEAYQKDQDKIDFYQSRKGRKELEEKVKAQRNYNRKFGIKDIVVVDPMYLKLDVRNGNYFLFKESEESKENLGNIISDIAQRLKLKHQILDVDHLNKNETRKFNDIRFVNEYFQEQMNLSEISTSPGLHQREIDEITKRYGTSYFLWTGVISARQSIFDAKGKRVASLIMLPLLPYALPTLFGKEHDTFIFAVLLDLKNGRRSPLKIQYIDGKDSDQMLKVHMYEALRQIVNE